MEILRPTWLLFSLVALHLPTPASAQAAAPSPVPPAAAPTPAAENAPATAPSAEGPSATTAAPRLEEVDQRLRIIERRWEVDQEIAAEKKAEQLKNPPGVAVAHGKDGVGIKSADGKFSFRLRPVVQADGRFFIKSGSNTFLLRRVRPVLEGTAFEFFDWRIMPELAGTPNVQDAYVNVRLIKEIQLRGGKYKPPGVGLERLQSDPDLQMMERGLPTNLVPDRDVGAQLHGELFDATIAYAVGIFNGVGDAVNGDLDNNDKKDLEGRLFVRPFAPTSVEPLQKLTLGISATRGTHVGPPPGYRTMGQQTFFTYADGAWAAGTHRRVTPQASYYFGPVGIMGEYVRSSQIMTSTAVAPQAVTHVAWQVVASVFLTGDEASFGTVTPKHQLDPARGTFGAFELAGRIGQLKIDAATFALKLADPTRSAEKAREWGVGLNWHLGRNFKWMLDYEHTAFDGGAKGADRPSEIVVLTRLQAAY
jgi:phosphate-selective porin OprO/OprP